MIYSWTFITFFFKLSSWIYYLTAKEISIVFAYAMVVDLFESILFLGGLLVLCLLLPANFLIDEFPVRGAWFVISFLGMLMVYLIPSIDIKQWIANPGVWIIISVFVTIILTAIFSYLNVTKRFAFFILDRMIVFLAIYMPLSVISLVVITIRLVL